MGWVPSPPHAPHTSLYMVLLYHNRDFIRSTIAETNLTICPSNASSSEVEGFAIKTTSAIDRHIKTYILTDGVVCVCKLHGDTSLPHLKWFIHLKTYFIPPLIFYTH